VNQRTLHGGPSDSPWTLAVRAYFHFLAVRICHGATFAGVLRNERVKEIGLALLKSLFEDLALVGAWIFLSSAWKGDTYVVKDSLAF
jgi:hypothetical protein